MRISYRQLTPQLKQQIIQAFEERMECREIPDFLNVSKRSVARVLAEVGIKALVNIECLRIKLLSNSRKNVLSQMPIFSL